VLGVSLDRLHQVGDEVEAAAELDVDLGPGVVAAVPQGNETVVHADGDDERQGDENQQKNGESHRDLLSSIGGKRTPPGFPPPRRFPRIRRNRPPRAEPLNPTRQKIAVSGPKIKGIRSAAERPAGASRPDFSLDKIVFFATDLLFRR